MATLFIPKLYKAMWLEPPSFVTSRFSHHSALIVPKDKLRQVSEHPQHCSDLLPLLGHSSNLRAYLE